MVVGVRDSGHDPLTSRIGTLLIAAVLVQWSLGLFNYLLLVPIWTQLSHLFMADVVWMTLVIFSASMLAEPSPQRVPGVPLMAMEEP
jgi:heme A synthase